MAPATSEFVYEPYGVVLIVGAFNYPIMLTLSPLLGAIMTGNVAVIKPSEMSVACEHFLATIIPKYLDNDCYKVICGGIQTSAGLLDQRWDKIFFTGSIRVVCHIINETFLSFIITISMYDIFRVKLLLPLLLNI